MVEGPGTLNSNKRRLGRGVWYLLYVGNCHTIDYDAGDLAFCGSQCFPNLFTHNWPKLYQNSVA